MLWFQFLITTIRDRVRFGLRHGTSTVVRTGRPDHAEMQVRDASFPDFENATSCAGSCFVAYLIKCTPALGHPPRSCVDGQLEVDVGLGEQQLRQQCRVAWD
jgi:hypothetical protein